MKQAAAYNMISDRCTLALKTQTNQAVCDCTLQGQFIMMFFSQNKYTIGAVLIELNEKVLY